MQVYNDGKVRALLQLQTDAVQKRCLSDLANTIKVGRSSGHLPLEKHIAHQVEFLLSALKEPPVMFIEVNGDIKDVGDGKLVIRNVMLVQKIMEVIPRHRQRVCAGDVMDNAPSVCQAYLTHHWLQGVRRRRRHGNRDQPFALLFYAGKHARTTRDDVPIITACSLYVGDSARSWIAQANDEGRLRLIIGKARPDGSQLYLQRRHKLLLLTKCLEYTLDGRNQRLESNKGCLLFQKLLDSLDLFVKPLDCLLKYIVLSSDGACLADFIEYLFDG